MDCQRCWSQRGKWERMQRPILIPSDVDTLDGCCSPSPLPPLAADVWQLALSTAAFDMKKPFSLPMTPHQSANKAPVLCLLSRPPHLPHPSSLTCGCVFNSIFSRRKTYGLFLQAGSPDRAAIFFSLLLSACQDSDTASLHFWLDFVAPPQPPLGGEGLVLLLWVAFVWLQRLLSKRTTRRWSKLGDESDWAKLPSGLWLDQQNSAVVIV